MALSHEIMEYREEKIAAYYEYKTGTYTYDDLDLQYMKIFYQRMILAALSADQAKAFEFPVTEYHKLFKISKEVFKKMLAFKNNYAKKVKGEAQRIGDINDELKTCESYIKELENFFNHNKAPPLKLEINNLVCFFQKDIVFNFLLGIQGKKSVCFQVLKKELENIKEEIGEKNHAILISKLEEANKLDKNKFKMDAFFVWQIIYYPKNILQTEAKATSKFDKFIDRISRQNLLRADLIRAIDPVHTGSKEVKRLNAILKKLMDAEWNIKMNPWNGIKKFFSIKEKYDKRAKKFNIAFEKANKKLKLSESLLEKNEQLDFKNEPASPLDLSGSSQLLSASGSDLSQSSHEAQTPLLVTSPLESDSTSALRSSSIFSRPRATPVIPKVPEIVPDPLTPKKKEGI